jgi:acetolactate synthase-1/2/3 large subunit
VTQGMTQYVKYDPTFDFEGLYSLGRPGSLDLVKFAESLGADARPASNLRDLRDAVQSAKEGAQQGKPQVVVAHIDRRRVPPYYLPPYRKKTKEGIGDGRERQTS